MRCIKAIVDPILVQRTEEALGRPDNPLALDVDILTGEFYFADFVTGKLYRVRLA